MRVIRKGELPEKRIWKGSCSHCGQTYEAEQGELKITSDQRDGDFGEARCTLCKQRVIFYPATKRLSR